MTYLKPNSRKKDIFSLKITAVAVLLASVLLLSACGSVKNDGPEKTAGDTKTETLNSTAEETTPATEATPFMYENYESHELIPDLKFERGIKIHSQKDHSNGEKFTTLGTHSFYGGEARAPRWGLAQWDSGPSLTPESVGKDYTEITDNVSKMFKYDPETNVMTFRLNTEAYYQGRPSKEGDYWPHLLIEQPEFLVGSGASKVEKYYSCGADAIICSFDIKLEDYKITNIDGDWVRAAQFLMYFYVKNADTNDFCWFGLQLFDNRWELNDNYIGYDGGKADASGAMIFSIGTKYIYTSGRTLYKDGRPDPGMNWLHVEIDIKPFLEKMFEHGKSDHYFKVKSLDELVLNGMNLGWETIGTFDHTMSVRNLSLKSYFKTEN